MRRTKALRGLAQRGAWQKAGPMANAVSRPVFLVWRVEHAQGQRCSPEQNESRGVPAWEHSELRFHTGLNEFRKTSRRGREHKEATSASRTGSALKVTNHTGRSVFRQ